MHLKLKTNKESRDCSQKRTNRKSLNMASSLANDDEDKASSSTTTTTTTTRNTQQQQSSSNNNNSKQNNNNADNSGSNNTATAAVKMQGNEAKLKKENLTQRKVELEKLLNEKSWLLQQLQKQETQILNGNFEYMNFNDFIQNLAVQYKHEQQTTDSVSSIGAVSNLTVGEEAILRRKPLAAKENQQHHNVLHRRQSEISNRSSEYDNYPHQDNLSTHSEGASSARAAAMTMQHAQQAQQQQCNAKSALKKRSATVAGTTQQSASNLQMIRQQHLEQQQQQYQQQQQQNMLYKQQQQQQHYHHPQQHLFKPHIEQHQVLMPHLQYATQKFYYTTLQATQPTTVAQKQQQQQLQQQQILQQQQQQYGRYMKAQPQQQQHNQQTHMHLAQNNQQQHSPNQTQQQHVHYTLQMPSTSGHQQQQHQQQLLLTPPHDGLHVDNISLYSLNSNNVATLHRQAQQQQPIIVQCDKYYLSPTSHHVSHNDGGGFIKSSQNIKEYVSPMSSPQQLLTTQVRDKRLTSQTNLSNRGPTPSVDAISLAPSYVSMETVDYMASPTSQHQQNNLRWRSQTNLPPPSVSSAEMKSHSSDMLNNNLYYSTALNPPPPSATHPPNVTQVKPFKPLDDISIHSYTSESQKCKTKSKQWLESSLDGPVIRQPHQADDNASTYANNNNNNNNNMQPRSKLSSQSLNTSRHYSMSAAQAKPMTSAIANNVQTTKLSQSTSYLNQLEPTPAPTSSISQAYNVESTSPIAYKYLPGSNNNVSLLASKPPARPPLYINASGSNQQMRGSPTAGPLNVGTSTSALSPEIRIESPKNMTVVQPATFQPYKEVTKPFEMSDFYKYSTKFRQKENANTTAQQGN